MSIINVDIDKCVGCNACVRACPVGDANIARMDAEGKLKIMIDDEKCIKCGACIRACSHSARSYIDDTQRFLQDLANGQEIALIAAPSIKIAFDGNWRHALQWLSNHGIKKIYASASAQTSALGHTCGIWRKIPAKSSSHNPAQQL